MTVKFGRPDIGAYLKETFAMQPEKPGRVDKNELDQSDVDVRAP